MSVSITAEADFQHILRILNTNVDGRQKIWIALTAIRGIGRRFSVLVCKKADIDINRRAGELSNEEVHKLVAIMSQPLQFKIPQWCLNRQKDFKDGKYKHNASTQLDASLREDLERLKKIRAHRGLRHWWGKWNFMFEILFWKKKRNS